MTVFPRVLFGAPSSNTGKTTVTCGVLQALKNRGIRPCSFKCGPDYVDPLFHRQVLGIPSYNLDLFFTSSDTARGLLAHYGGESDIGILEGVMGFYDGIGASNEASSWQVAVETNTPVILVVTPKGMAGSVVPLIQGFRNFQTPSCIQGVLLNRTSPSLYHLLAPEIEKKTGLPVLGYLPEDPEIAVESGQLGLKLEESETLRRRFAKLSHQIEETVDVEGILNIARSAGPLESGWQPPDFLVANHPVIGVAKDAAFSFQYAENMDLLRWMGAELLEVSPLEDTELPIQLDGLYLGGGHPYEYAEWLSGNHTFRQSVYLRGKAGLPIYGEGGGFLYLQGSLQVEGDCYPMVGLLPGAGQPSSRLGNFGYFHGTLKQPLWDTSFQPPLKGHEFHYWKSTEEGDDLTAKKPTGHRSWNTGYNQPYIFAGFPYFYFPGNPELASAFVTAASAYKKGREKT